ncbi:protein FliT [Paraburkholderia sp. RAU2J]|uniref:flagellar protein FliT n=1 Tax=Paraburkholderia sp. RAU2J TaxID=1938810 RepID=UPI000EB540BD|nr:flagellar protein FliT [Paraburkholderia sp. RAU2J]RKT25465.1 protein FliT [Paraburkholderia sp. RAU2J]
MEFATRIDRIWELTKSIEQAAAVADWERAAQLADERSPLLMSLDAQQAPAALDVLRLVHEIDTRIAAEAQLAQSELAAEYQASMRATRNVSQYQRIAQF